MPVSGDGLGPPGQVPPPATTQTTVRSVVLWLQAQPPVPYNSTLFATYPKRPRMVPKSSVLLLLNAQPVAEQAVSDPWMSLASASASMPRSQFGANCQL